MTGIVFRTPLACASKYPEPIVSATPKLFNVSLRDNTTTSSQFRSNAIFTKNGRTALAYLISAFDLKEKQTVLLPEYHCPAMVEPFLWAGVNILFYSLNEDLSVNMTSLENLLPKADTLLLVRFFGFKTNIEQALLLANRHNTNVIEDCAHAYFSSQLIVDGISSDASFCSLNKFFSCSDGGMLKINNQKYSSVRPELNGPTFLQNMKHVISQFPLVSALSSLKSKAINKQSNSDNNTDITPSSSYKYFNAEDLKHTCFQLTKFQVSHQNLLKVKQARQSHFEKLFQSLQASPLGKPLFAPDTSVVPYVFPFLLNDGKDFDFIRNKGVQILRWEEYCETTNETIENLRERLVQVPCHQDLTQAQLTHIIETFNKK